MSALALSSLDVSALARFGVLRGAEGLSASRTILDLGWPELERALPDHGFPCGVIEIAACPPRIHRSRGAALCPESMRGGGTSIALAAITAAHARDPRAWCAWVTPRDVTKDPTKNDEPSLYAPALVHAGVDLARLLVVRPSPRALARTVVKMAASGAFTVLVVDVPNPQDLSAAKAGPQPRWGSDLEPRKDRGTLVVRKLALSAEELGTTSILLTSALAPRPAPWPVALRLEVERRPEALSLRITKDRRGCGSSHHVIRLAS